jgi:hypothetical protein
MDLIYITEDPPEQPYPNFTMPGKDPLENSTIKTAQIKPVINTDGIASKVALSLLTVSTPLSLLVGAATIAPILVKAFSSKDGAEEVSKESVAFLNDFIQKHSICVKDAIDRGYQFPPGHPRVGETYRLHPLAKYPPSCRKDLYIPEQNYDALLFEERESELLSILVNLGAVEVEIAKYIERLTETEKAANLNAGVDLMGEGAISHNSSLGKENNEKNVRLFTLRGMPWKYGENKLDKDAYAWLNFEPSWNALITAREIGNCTSATLEIKEVSKYGANREMAIKIKAKIYSATGGLKVSDKDLKETSYIVKVKFS